MIEPMDSKDRLFAEIAVRLLLLSREQISRCAQQMERVPGAHIDEVAIEFGFLSEAEVALVHTQQARTFERQRAVPRQDSPIGTAALLEERVQKADPRSASAPPKPAAKRQTIPAPATKRRSMPAPSAKRQSVAAPAAKPVKRSGPRAWEAPSEPAQGQVHIARGETRTTPVDIAPPPSPSPTRAVVPPAPVVEPVVRALPTVEKPPPVKWTRSHDVDSFPLAQGAAAADLGDLATSTQAPTITAKERTVMWQAGAPAPGSVQASFAAAESVPQPLAEPPKPISAVASATLLHAFSPLRTTPGARPAVMPAKAAAPVAAVPAARGYLAKALALAAQKGASDLHVHSGAPLLIRVDGEMVPLSDMTAISPESASKIIAEVATEAQWAQLKEKGEVDFAYSLPGTGRFRANVYRQQRGIDAVFRIIPVQPPTLEQLGLPSHLSRLIEFRTGLVLCTGPTRSGKSSTLAALLSLLIGSRSEHVLTIEDPVEFVFPPGRAHVSQRQVGDHTGSFSRALRAALREDPDVIAITELRDRETISLAMTAAETGHLVLGTLHTSNAVQTINRIVAAFPANEQEQVRSGLADSLRVVVSQRLVKKATGAGRVPAIEVLMVNTAVSNLIRDDKTHQLGSAMQTGKAAGMITLDDSLLALVVAGTVTKEAARRIATKKDRFV